jgi:uncharacterized protein (DUF433 family)
MEPVFGSRENSALSFLELVEVIVVTRFRNGSGRLIPLGRLRAAHAFARERLGIEYPFASGKLWTEGGHIMHAFEQAYPGPGRFAIDLHGMYALPIEFEETASGLEFDTIDTLASRWYPAGRDVPVVLDPSRGAGWPVVEGSNVRTEVLAARWKAGETMEELSADFELPTDVVEEVLRVAA